MSDGILTLLSSLKASVLAGLMKYTTDTGQVATPRQIAIVLLSMVHTVSKKDPKFQFAKALAMLMVEACRYDRELAHAAIDDAFDDEARKKAKKEPPKKPAA